MQISPIGSDRSLNNNRASMVRHDHAHAPPATRYDESAMKSIVFSMKSIVFSTKSIVFHCFLRCKHCAALCAGVEAVQELVMG
jgi:hypothetical protein